MVTCAFPGENARVAFDKHLMCMYCESIIDIENKGIWEIAWPGVRDYGFEIRDCHIHFRGICTNCR